jgi:cysteinyl-tRNA synthetase
VFERPIQVSPEHEAAAQQKLDESEPEAVRRLLLSEPLPGAVTLECERDERGGLRLPQLERAMGEVTHVYASKRRLCSLPEERIAEVDQKAPAEVAGLRVRLVSALGADLQTSVALAEVTRFLLAVNDMTDRALRKRGSLARSQRSDALRGFDTIAELLTLGVEQPRTFLERQRDRQAAARGISKQLVERKIQQRAAAREERDFARADLLRAELTELGVELLEFPSGTEWTVI